MEFSVKEERFQKLNCCYWQLLSFKLARRSLQWNIQRGYGTILNYHFSVVPEDGNKIGHWAKEVRHGYWMGTKMCGLYADSQLCNFLCKKHILNKQIKNPIAALSIPKISPSPQPNPRMSFQFKQTKKTHKESHQHGQRGSQGKVPKAGTLSSFVPFLVLCLQMNQNQALPFKK